MKRHKNLLWLQVDAAVLPTIRKDRILNRMLLTEATTGMFAIRINDREAVLGRLEKLGLTPRLREG